MPVSSDFSESRERSNTTDFRPRHFFQIGSDRNIAVRNSLLEIELTLVPGAKNRKPTVGWVTRLFNFCLCTTQLTVVLKKIDDSHAKFLRTRCFLMAKLRFIGI